MSATLPSGYVEVGRWDLDSVRPWMLLVLLAVSLATLFVTINIALAILYVTAGVASFPIEPSAVVLGILLGLVLHELSHATAFLALGGRPRFGHKAWTKAGPVLSVSAPGFYFSRRAYLLAGVGAVLVLAAVLLGVVAVAPAGGLLSTTAAIAAAVNVAGASGDALIARTALSYPSTARFEDTGSGFVVYAPASGARAI